MTAPLAAQTTATTRGTSGAGSMDVIPANGSVLLVGTPGSVATQNQYSNLDVITITSATGTSLTFPSQTIAKTRAVGDFIFLVDSGPVSPLSFAPATFLNTVYFGLSAQPLAGATQTNVLNNEPTTAGGYVRAALLNNATNFPAATSSGPASKSNGVAIVFGPSSGAWSTGAIPLLTGFLSDAPTNQGGNVLAVGAVSPLTDVVTGAGVSLTITVGGFVFTLS